MSTAPFGYMKRPLHAQPAKGSYCTAAHPTIYHPQTDSLFQLHSSLVTVDGWYIFNSVIYLLLSANLRFRLPFLLDLYIP